LERLRQCLIEAQSGQVGTYASPGILTLDYLRVKRRNTPVNQCGKPTGCLGRFTLWRMNSSHSKPTDWGLEQISVENHHTILDAGCGGGRTVSKLAAIATQGKVYGVDYSEESVATTKKTNAQWIGLGHVEVRHGSVSLLPFPDGMFDLVTAVETHFWWPDLPGDMREIFRVLKPGGTLVLVAEVYKGASTMAAKVAFLSRLRFFLKRVQPMFTCRFAVEIRNKNWLDARFADLLREYNVALVLTDQSWMPRPTELFEKFDPITSDFCYVRWLGNRREIEEQTVVWDKTIIDREVEISEWVQILKRVVARGIKAFAYANNHFAGFGPGTVKLFWETWNKKQ
jgi:ubiquinone/menaquinone biosynthesis C-methylase UbiE